MTAASDAHLVFLALRALEDGTPLTPRSRTAAVGALRAVLTVIQGDPTANLEDDLAAASGVRAAAAHLLEQADRIYPTDVFLPPTAQDYEEINSLLKRERGHQLDGVAADVTRRAYTVAAGLLDTFARDTYEPHLPD